MIKIIGAGLVVSCWKSFMKFNPNPPPPEVDCSTLQWGEVSKSLLTDVVQANPVSGIHFLLDVPGDDQVTEA